MSVFHAELLRTGFVLVVLGIGLFLRHIHDRHWWWSTASMLSTFVAAEVYYKLKERRER